MPLNLVKLYKITNNSEEIIVKLREWNLIPLEGAYDCPNPKCAGKLKLVASGRVDGFLYRCYSKYQKRAKQKVIPCGKRVEFRKGTIFENSKLSLMQILGFVHMRVNSISLKFISNELEMNIQTAVNWAALCRQVLLDFFLNNKEKLGGPGKTVVIDYYKCRTKKNSKGRISVEQWVFRGNEQETGKIFMVAVKPRGADTLISIIHDWVLEGTTIITDFCKVHDCTESVEYQYFKESHLVNIKEPETEAQINSSKPSLKAVVMYRAGGPKADLPGKLAMCMFRNRCALRNSDPTVEFYRIIGHIYNCTAPKRDLRL